MSNPFQFNYPTSPEKFVGRWDIVNKIAKDLFEGGSSHAIIAGKRCGKTSLLYSLQTTLLKHLAETKLGEWHVLPVFLDIMRLDKKSPLGVYQGLVRNLQLLTTRKEFAFDDGPVLPLDLNISLLDEYCNEYSSVSDLDRFVRILAYVSGMAKDKYGPLRFVFLIDEIEEISEQEWTNELFGNLRSLTQDPHTSSHIRLVMAGSQRFLHAQRRPGSPILNILMRHFLEAFSDEAVLELISFGGKFMDIVSQEVIRLSGGHPYIIQFLMHYIWDRRDEITPSDIESIGYLLFESYVDIPNNWCEAIGYSGKYIFAAIAEIDEWITLQNLRKTLKHPGIDIQEGLNALMYHNLIIYNEKERKYKCGGEIFRDWFLATQNIEQKLWKKGESSTMALPPEVVAQGLSFLFDVGKLAASELKERWTLARQKRSAEQATEIDLSKPKEEVEPQAKILLQDLAAQHGLAEVERVFKLVQQQRKLVFEWKQAKLDLEEEYNRQRVTLTALRRNQEDLDEKIAKALEEIETTLKELDLQIEKEKISQAAN